MTPTTPPPASLNFYLVTRGLAMAFVLLSSFSIMLLTGPTASPHPWATDVAKGGPVRRKLPEIVGDRVDVDTADVAQEVVQRDSSPSPPEALGKSPRRGWGILRGKKAGRQGGAGATAFGSARPLRATPRIVKESMEFEYKFDILEALVAAPACRTPVFLVDFTFDKKLSPRRLRAIEAVLSSTPDACVALVSPVLPLDALASVSWLAGRPVAVARPNLLRLLPGTPAEPLARRMSEWALGSPSFIEDAIDLLKAALLNRFGGVALDADVIAVRSLAGLGDAVASATGPAGPSAGAALVAAAAPGSRFLASAMAGLAADLDRGALRRPREATLVGRALKGATAAARPRLLPLDAVEPIPRPELRAAFAAPATGEAGVAADARYRAIAAGSTAVHFWEEDLGGDVLAAEGPEGESLMLRVLNEGRCLPANARGDGRCLETVR